MSLILADRNLILIILNISTHFIKPHLWNKSAFNLCTTSGSDIPHWAIAPYGNPPHYFGFLTTCQSLSCGTLMPHVIQYTYEDTLLTLFKLLHLHWSTTAYSPRCVCLPHCAPHNGFRTKMFRKEWRGRRRDSDSNLNERQHSYLDLQSPPYSGQYLTSNIIPYFSSHSGLKALPVVLWTHQAESRLRSL